MHGSVRFLLVLALVAVVAHAADRGHLRSRIRSRTENPTPAPAAAHAAAAAKPVCLFLHGLGQKYTKSEILDSLTDYWGDVGQKVSQYCTPKFATYESTLRGFEDKSMQTEMCGFVDKSGASIVFAHSNANPILVNAINNKVGACARFAKYSPGAKPQKGQVLYVALQAPLGVSPAAESCLQLCGSSGFVDAVKDVVKEAVDVFHAKFSAAKADAKKTVLDAAAMVPIAKSECGCQPTKLPGGAIVGLTSKVMVPAVAKALSDGATDYAWRMLCGISANPAGHKLVDSTFLPLLYWTLAHSVGYGVDKDTTAVGATPIHGTDGFVGFSTCHANHKDSEWGWTPTARLYVGRMNHGDGTGRSGDGSHDDEKAVSFIVDAAKTLSALIPK